MYISTRGTSDQPRLTASQAILQGIAQDGGLFVPDHIDTLDLNALVGKDYATVAREVLALFLDDFSPAEVQDVVAAAYNDANFAHGEVALRRLGDLTVLELFHGPTLAFKDMALTILPHLMRVSKAKQQDHTNTLIMVATSGDTGGAALSGFRTAEGFDTLVLYPNGGVSEMQEKQMLSFCGEHTRAWALDGNFDDCQTFVKQVFGTYTCPSRLSSANSINIGRLVPQVVYYAYAYCHLVREGVLAMGEAMDVVVPTGNFGDIFAAYFAKLAGVPIATFVCASNANNVLYDFFRTGVYDANRPFFKTFSPAMDILVSSNLERLLWYACGGDGTQVAAYMAALKKEGRFVVDDAVRRAMADFAFGYADDDATLATVRQVYDRYHYVVDPHTAVAFYCYDAYHTDRHALLVSTASPFKFPTTIARALGLDTRGNELAISRAIAAHCGITVPAAIEALFAADTHKHITTREEVVDYVHPTHIRVTVPCSTANLGCAFDIAGLSLDMYNTFAFAAAAEDSVVGCPDDVEDNLIMRAYRHAFRALGAAYVPVSIRAMATGIPMSSGLGSSASCIVAGVLAAAYFANSHADSRTLLGIMTKLEGHPDNVAAAYLGGLVVNVADGGDIASYRMPVCPDLVFTALIPNFGLPTKQAREVLPKQIGMADAIHNAARCALLPTALATGDVALLAQVFDDRWHQPYRIPLIEGAATLFAALRARGFAVAISGAGPTILAVGKRALTAADIPQGFADWRIRPLRPAGGAVLK